jgi:hypothetical protein
MLPLRTRQRPQLDQLLALGELLLVLGSHLRTAQELVSGVRGLLVLEPGPASRFRLRDRRIAPDQLADEEALPRVERSCGHRPYPSSPERARQLLQV